MTLFVVDASVAVRWLVALPHADQARDLLGHRLMAPELIQAEVGSALVKLVRAKVLTRRDGEEAFDDFFRAPIRIVPAHGVAQQAMKLALQAGLSFYDCLYLALAEAAQGQFATADARFWTAMQDTPHARHIYFIGAS